MANVLYLVHRLPYPPNKGDKVRSFHLLQHIARNHKIFLGTFVDDPADFEFVAKVKSLCCDVKILPLNTRVAKVKSLVGLLTGEPLTLPYYRNVALQAWVDQVIENHAIDTAIIFSSAMAQYVLAGDEPKVPNILVDFVDVDSAKWQQYAGRHRWPFSSIYRREGQKLLAFERLAAKNAKRSFFVTPKEVELFCTLAPEIAEKVESVGNGVNADFFSPVIGRACPYSNDEIPIVFTGAMDYWPNIDAVTWFVREILPLLKSKHSKLKFYIVGRSPTEAVQGLASEAVSVTGTVVDVRPYLQFAAIAVAPLRLARGIQNKVLEAMAMEIPVVASQECASPISAIDGEDFLVADTVEDYVRHIDRLLNDRKFASYIGKSGRSRILDDYTWDAHLSVIDRCLGGRVDGYSSR